MEGQGKETADTNDAKCCALWTSSKEKTEGGGKWRGKVEKEGGGGEGGREWRGRGWRRREGMEKEGGDREGGVGKKENKRGGRRKQRGGLVQLMKGPQSQIVPFLKQFYAT